MSEIAMKNRAELESGKPIMTRALILLMAVACGLSVANLYYNQPLLADIGRTFHATAREVGSVSMLTQIGYAIGMFLFVPLGDMKERRGLIVMILLAEMVALIGVASSQSILWINIASLAVGFTAVTTQIIIPLAAHLAPPAERGKVIGTVMSGLLIGILLARTVSGVVGGFMGWRSMYVIAAALMLILAIVLWKVLPKAEPQVSLTYRQLMRSITELIRTQPVLREASLLGALMFGGFSVFWTALAFYVEGSPYHYGSEIAGLFGLVGVLGAAIAPAAGRLTDRFSAVGMVGIFIALALLSYLSFWIVGSYLWGLILGVILLDLGVQGSQISNQARIYALVPEARSRINTVFMVSTFIGGSIGSALGSYAWSIGEWNGVCAAGGCMVGAGAVVWAVQRMKRNSVRKA
ncbi:Predicted arabinose efflux permease, MFS family [Paenibacillus sp. 1_12]|uniref:MFS transporter n=1 Tax=Paenibacillus sp. 1_12 TaxID=1566278 RepID=UPI0008EEB4FB|nr:MFS transporter [Paenibacillus sp. 1_12]SFL74093.1 Predicted arabinose efflux permease, MFS family [Paenibacillus sp. 1_12]